MYVVSATNQVLGYLLYVGEITGFAKIIIIPISGIAIQIRKTWLIPIVIIPQNIQVDVL